MPYDGTNFEVLPREARVIDAALEILGENGEHWSQGDLADGRGSYCMIGAIRLARRRNKIRGDKTENFLALSLYHNVRCYGVSPQHPVLLIAMFNDGPRVRFGDIKVAMLKVREDVLKRYGLLANEPRDDPYARERLSALVQAEQKRRTMRRAIKRTFKKSQGATMPAA